MTSAYAAFAAIILDHAHLISSFIVAWGNRDMRGQMLRRTDKFIALPLAILGVGVIFGLAFARHDWPIEALVFLYLIWNAYHFAMQNYGLLALAGWRRLGRFAWFATLVTLLVPAGPIGGLTQIAHSWWHWLSAIGLGSAAAKRWWLFLALVLPLGLIGFLWKTVNCQAVCHTAVFSLPILLATRLCLGFNHFLYDRWVWRHDSPLVRGLRAATPGRIALNP